MFRQGQGPCFKVQILKSGVFKILSGLPHLAGYLLRIYIIIRDIADIIKDIGIAYLRLVLFCYTRNTYMH